MLECAQTNDSLEKLEKIANLLTDAKSIKSDKANEHRLRLEAETIFHLLDPEAALAVLNNPKLYIAIERLLWTGEFDGDALERAIKQRKEKALAAAALADQPLPA